MLFLDKNYFSPILILEFFLCHKNLSLATNIPIPVGGFEVNDLQDGIQALTEWTWSGLLDMVGGLVLAELLAAAIAYHPKTYDRFSKSHGIDQPKTYIMYALVAAVCAKIVNEVPEIAFVVFGIGGLMRFRTDVGASKHTGRLILVTMIGLACGLNLLMLAVVATIFGWLLIYLLERHVTYHLLVKGLDKNNLLEATYAYRALLFELDCYIVDENRNSKKGQISFVFHAPGSLIGNRLDEVLNKKMPEAIRGFFDWNKL